MSLTGDQLDAATFPPLTWSVPGILPEGFGILSAPPKAGKSWLVLAIGLAVAKGENVLGVQTEQRPVLYLALEDSYRRLQDRSRTLLGDSPIPNGIVTDTDAEQALKKAEEFIREREGQQPLVILDTLGVVKPPRKPGAEAYATDYAFSRQLKALATQGSTFLAVHHNRKAESDSFLDLVSGTHGIAGAADFVMVLVRKDHQRNAVLNITGRDVEEASYALLFDGGKWTVSGDSLDEAARRAGEKRLGETKLAVLQLVNSRTQTSAKDVTEHLRIAGTAARQTLSRLADSRQIVRSAHGMYSPVTQSHSGDNT